MRKPRKDVNHNSLVKVFSSLHSPSIDLSSQGKGLPDSLVWIYDRWEFVEIKNRGTSYGKKGLNPNQLAWLDKYPQARVFVVECEDDCINLVNRQYELVKWYSADKINIPSM